MKRGAGCSGRMLVFVLLMTLGGVRQVAAGEIIDLDFVRGRGGGCVSRRVLHDVVTLGQPGHVAPG